MLVPKKPKYRRWQKARVNKNKPQIETRGISVSFGSYGMKAKTGGALRSNQIEAARRVITRSIGKTGKIWIRVFPDRPWTKKAAEHKMGKGKGNLEGYEFRVLPGRVIFEISGVEKDIADNAIKKAGKKLPFKIAFVEKVK